jgi:hypothetical protein
MGAGVSLAVQAALGNDPRTHIKPLGTGGIVFWAVFTLIWLVQIARFRVFWGASPSFATFSEQARPIQQTFRRQAPAALIWAGFVIPLGWLAILFPNAGWVIAPALLLTVPSVLGAFVVGSVWLFNRPRGLVPPQLRDLPGVLAKPKG